LKRIILASAMLAMLSACDKSQDTTATDDAITGPMSFFITSIGVGDGANLGGLEGADEHCQNLADDVDAGDKTWRAYLSTTGRIDRENPENNSASVHARDRIGKGPWFNAKGELIARDVEHLHSNNNINKQTALNEKGEMVNGLGEQPNEHDILTGSRPDGTAFSPHVNFTCKNWWSNEEGAAAVGHHDKTGPTEDNWAKSWNFSHFSMGCSQEALESTGGAGLIYCFAID